MTRVLLNGYVAQRIEDVLRALTVRYVPQDVCSQSGVHFQLGMFNVSIDAPNAAQTRIIFNGNTQQFSDRVFGYLRQELQRLGPIDSTWNGQHGQTTVSAIVRRAPPRVLLDACARYGTLRDVFALNQTERIAFARFDSWVAARLDTLAWYHQLQKV